MEALLISGLLLVLTGYVCRIVLPLLCSLFWQFASAMLPSVWGQMTTPEDSESFFYVPKGDDPLIFRWYWPNHAKCIGINFTAGVVLAWLGISEEVDLVSVFTPLVIAVGFLSFGVRTYQSISKKESLWVGCERLLFTAFALIELLVGLDVISMYLG